MAKIEPISAIEQIHGKLHRTDLGYFYVKHGKQFYRTREEKYQVNQSPRQKWNSAAFAYAHKQLHNIEASPESKKIMETEYIASKGLASNGKTYSTAHAWKFNSLLHEYKQSHPFIQ